MNIQSKEKDLETEGYSDLFRSTKTMDEWKREIQAMQNLKDVSKGKKKGSKNSYEAVRVDTQRGVSIEK